MLHNIDTRARELILTMTTGHSSSSNHRGTGSVKAASLNGRMKSRFYSSNIINNSSSNINSSNSNIINNSSISSNIINNSSISSNTINNSRVVSETKAKLKPKTRKTKSTTSTQQQRRRQRQRSLIHLFPFRHRTARTTSKLEAVTRPPALNGSFRRSLQRRRLRPFPRQQVSI
jgi:hypothetical protein